jgi:hypothetical protein
VRWNNKTAFLGIAAARDTSKLVRFVKDILDPGFLVGVDDEEARLVFNIVQRLPERDRERFRHLDDGKWWQKMCGELDIQDKGATDANFYEDDAAMQKLLADLSANLENWPKARVDNAVGMLIAERKTDDVEKLLQDRGLDTKAEHDWLFDKYGFARAGGQRDPKVHGRFKAKSTGQKLEARSSSPRVGRRRKTSVASAVRRRDSSRVDGVSTRPHRRTSGRKASPSRPCNQVGPWGLDARLPPREWGIGTLGNIR